MIIYESDIYRKERDPAMNQDGCAGRRNLTIRAFRQETPLNHKDPKVVLRVPAQYCTKVRALRQETPLNLGLSFETQLNCKLFLRHS